MVVDDSHIIRDFVELIVAKSDDIEVVAKVGTGAEALAQLDSIAINAVTLDLGLPDINGTELLDLIVA